MEKLQQIVKNNGSTLVLRGAIALIGLIVLAVCVFALPAGILSDNTGAYRPILIGLYLPAIPFFVALLQGLKLLGFVDKNTAFSEASVQALKVIKYCAITISGLFIAGLPYIYLVADRDDAPGVILFSMVIVFVSFIVATFAGVLQKLFQNAVTIKSENDLTV